MWDPRWAVAMQQTNAQHTGDNGQSGEGIITAMQIGAGLGGFVQCYEVGAVIRKRNVVGTLHAYYQTSPESPLFPFAGASGISLSGNWDQVISVNQVGNRFYNEMMGTYSGEAQYPPGRRAMTAIGDGSAEAWTQWDWRNCSTEYIKSVYDKSSYNDAALMMNEGSQPPDFDPGPLWTIFDAGAVTRAELDVNYPAFTYNGYSFSANTIAELASQMTENQYQNVALSNLEATVARYNGFVDAGVDSDFARPAESLQWKIETPPFYAAWNTHMLHDTVGGVSVNGKMQVKDTRDNVIPGLYAAGEMTASNTQHGLGRCVTQGFIAGGWASQ
jgi:hypothetical protein